MGRGARWAIAVAMLLFAAGVVWTSIPRSPHTCEVCLDFGADRVCRRGAGETAEAARTAAQESACGGNARGMSEMIACRNAIPAAVTCTGPD
jgi:hypothetical protein